MGEPVRVAVLEPDVLLRELFAQLLRGGGHSLTVAAADPEELFRQMDLAPPAVLLLRVSAGMSRADAAPARAWQVLAEVGRAWPEVRSLVLLDVADPALTARAAGLGAHEVLCTAREGTRALLSAVACLARGERRVTEGLFARPASAVEPGSSTLPLTPKERAVLRYIAHGMDNLKVAAHMGISERTVKAHVTQLYRKLGVENRAEMALRARALGLQLALPA